jgi:hypothetical protein
MSYLVLPFSLLLAGCFAGGRSAVVSSLYIWHYHLSAYAERAEHKSLALAPGIPIFALGYSSGYESEATANDRALRECNEALANAGMLFGSKPDGLPCALYAIGDVVIWDFPEATVMDVRVCQSLPEVQRYMASVQAQVSNMWQRFATRPSDTIVMELTLDATGALQRARVLQATSSKARSEAEEAVEAAAPFWPMFGAAACLADQPVRLQWGEDKAAA